MGPTGPARTFLRPGSPRNSVGSLRVFDKVRAGPVGPVWWNLAFGRTRLPTPATLSEFGKFQRKALDLSFLTITEFPSERHIFRHVPVCLRQKSFIPNLIHGRMHGSSGSRESTRHDNDNTLSVQVYTLCPHLHTIQVHRFIQLHTNW